MPQLENESAKARSDNGPRSNNKLWGISASVAHYLVLGAGFLAIFMMMRTQWFYFDDWAFLVPSQEGRVWEPHVGHWSVAPFSVFLLLRDLFGLNSYVPFGVAVLVAHLAFVHVTWRVMRRCGVAVWLATAASVPLTFLGAGAENILWAFQFGFITAALLAMVALLLLLVGPIPWWKLVIIGVLAAIAPMFSGTALPVLVATGLVALRRIGMWKTLAVFSPAALVYLIWYVVVGRLQVQQGRANDLTDLLVAVPRYVGEMFSAGLGAMFPVEVFGAILAFALVLLLGVRWGVLSTDGLPALVLALAALVFAFLTAFSRVNLGIESAAAGRYAYLLIFLTAPMIVLGLQWAIGAHHGIGIAVILAIGIFNAGLLISAMVTQQGIEGGSRARISAAIALAHDDPGAFEPGEVPDPVVAPDLTMADVIALARSGSLQATEYAAGDRLSVELNVAVDIEPAETAAQTCASDDEQEISVPSGEAVTVRAPSGIVDLRLTDSTGTSAHREVTTDGAALTMTNRSNAVLTVTSEGTLERCG
ncbi:hypothetical protein [Agromyces humi]|uniref:hypothetical protein n=1 Tax=Agromyces humi TaxID=1766800 RepID=UPI00135B8459|nr:hypothetical protein [Agromyces humi]